MSRLLVMTWLWQQDGCRTVFKAEHVNIWAAMVRRHCTLPIELACVTNVPAGIDRSIRIIEPPGFHDDLKTTRWRGNRPSCYRRLAMFRSDAANVFGARRFVSMDLDCVIGGSLDRILDRPEDFVICASSQNGPRWIYNGSMLMMDAGARPCVYDDFSPEGAEQASARFVGSDQAWIAYTLGAGEATWTPDHGVVKWNGDRSGPLMFFPGNTKPWHVIGDPFVGEHYRLDDGRSGLILGDKPHIWKDVEREIGKGPFEVVVALPKAARVWKGRVDHIAEDMGHAKRLARMLGVAEPVVCGA